MNLNDTSFLSLKIQQSPAPKETMTKSFSAMPQQQQHQQSPAPQSLAIQQKPPQQPVQQQETPNKPQPVAQPQKSQPTASSVINRIPQNISFTGSPAPTFPKLTNKGLAATSTPGQFSFNTSSPTPASITTTSITGFDIKPSASEPIVQQPAAQKSLFSNLPAQMKPATEQTNPAFGSLASKPTEKAAPSSFAFNLGSSNKTNEAPKQSLFGAAAKPALELKTEEKKPEETKPADKKTTEPTKPAAVSSLSFDAATDNEKPSLFGSASASSGFSFGAGLGSVAASATPVKPSFSFSAASSTPVADPKPVAAEAKKEPTPVAETKKSEKPQVEAKKPEETKKPSLLFGQTTTTTGASLFGNKTSTPSLFGVRLDRIVY